MQYLFYIEGKKESTESNYIESHGNIGAYGAIIRSP